jgi:hypothetical protein
MADRLRVTELDFDTIKQNLKTFLKQQNEFSDYDFEGSGLSVLLDILAYNTHYNAYYLNMVANESFLDTALLRDSVVSHAKTLGYTPYSTKAPVAIIDFTVNSGSTTASTCTLPEGYSFLSNQIDSKSYNFVVLEDTTVTKSNTQFVFENLKIYEGQLVTYSFTYDEGSNPKSIFQLPEPNIDTTTIKVSVTPNPSSSDTIVYEKVLDVLDIRNTSEVFFLQEGRGGLFEIYFGNDVVGKKLADGSIVSVTYLVTNGIAANKANNFVATATITDSIGNPLSNFIITPQSSASGGADRESVDNIKFSAAARFSTQNRLVTFKDYQSYVLNNYPNINSISVWGGEDNNPPVYGKVFVSLNPKTNYFINDVEKQRIIDEIIKPKSIVAVDIEIIDPEYLYIALDPKVLYDDRKTTQTPQSLINSIRNAIISYKNTYLNKFDSQFVLSKLIEDIDSVNTNAIVGTKLPRIILEKRFKPSLNQSKNYEINFNNELNKGSAIDKFTSTQFVVTDSTGVERIVNLEEIENSFTGISSISLTNLGFGYTSTPTVTITGDGIGATAEAVVVNGRIESIQITNRGINYSRAVVSITGGGGFGATASAIIDLKFGVLRLVYFDETAQKQILSSNIGEINYDTGQIKISDLIIKSVLSSDGFIKIRFKAEESIIRSTRNTIITIDEESTDSISVTLEKVDV